MAGLAVIHVDALRREYPAHWLLAKRLELAGFRVVLTSRHTTHRYLRFVKPDILILSHPFAIPPDLLKKAASDGVTIFVHEVEGVIRIEAGIGSTYPENIDYTSFRRLFVWNEWSRQWLIRNRSIPPEVAVASGSIRNAFKDVTEPPTGPKRRVGMIGRFDMVNPFDGRHDFESLLHMSNYHLTRWHVDMESFIVYRDIIAGLIENGIDVSIRPHPNENIQSYSLLRKHFGEALSVDSGFDFYGWLEKVDVVVGTFSSSFAEPYLLDKPIICIDELLTAKGPDTHVEWKAKSLTGVYLPGTVDEAIALAAKPDLSPKSTKVLDDFYNEVYALDTVGWNSLDVITGIACADSPVKNSRGAYGLYALAVKCLLDLAVVTRSKFVRRGPWSFRNQLQYNYNSWLHRPTEFMRRAWSGIERRSSERRAG